mmetsp:Transcript_13667/g.31837  ORF Transcript_13667/g.31837 Transcript_13667/m.31837 type:complete len:226 (+) Transcript_13667:37-714(+)
MLHHAGRRFLPLILSEVAHRVRKVRLARRQFPAHPIQLERLRLRQAGRHLLVGELLPQCSLQLRQRVDAIRTRCRQLSGQVCQLLLRVAELLPQTRHLLLFRRQPPRQLALPLLQSLPRSVRLLGCFIRPRDDLSILTHALRQRCPRGIQLLLDVRQRVDSFRAQPLQIGPQARERRARVLALPLYVAEPLPQARHLLGSSRPPAPLLLELRLKRRHLCHLRRVE